MSATDYKFEGWGAFGPDSVEGNFKKFEYEPKPWEETDVDIKIMYCGVCGSDLHTASSGWGAADYPQVVGHEICGVAVRVGSKVTHIKEGDIVGVGAQCDSCNDCRECNKQKENRCTGMVGTYGGKFKKEGPAKDAKSYGGYASYNRSPGHFVVKIPDGLDPAFAAPMLCGGVTVYNPLVSNGAGPGVDVGVIGIGGLGHFALLFAKALGANVTAISHSERKKEDAMKLGASKFIATHSGGEQDFAPHARSLDLIIATTNDPEMPLGGYLSLLRPDGKLILVGAPEKPLPALSPFQLIPGSISIGGSIIGSPSLISEMLDLAVKHKVEPWVQKRSMDKVNEVIPLMNKGDVKYRYVLVNEENGGKL
ncbi:hypothetical protein FFLO_05499 [Filobasidium floriforme]|uniref:alcohol dehydrogenase (NADP(+)) n=1 Tax=Filobasidium floriforme TaxID=5210 RepID=A0A8K0NNT1_9TREE|nr:putative NADP-dependent alcohol dehydrogenase C 2 [Filobasidium floriforme]KAG7529693.1 hypothetical protein FFLO_05499 [Filobasidium floriforme]KAH8081853.1 putative NADP-dependent alcohol dehydrogenase C 2 [Filobasidium floriforme]